MELPGVSSAVLEALKSAALDAGIPRLALVGGVVRDLLLHRRLGRPWAGVPDLDWVVEGEAARLAAVLRSRCGPQRVTAVQEYGTFGTVALQLDGVPLDLATARQERYPAPAQNPVVQAGPLSADLVRRDFTINAMALDLLSGELVDPHGGLRDLEQGRLVFLHDKSVSDDPTRVIRAARYAARLGLQLSPEATRQVMQTLKSWPWAWRSGDAPESAPPALATRLRMELDRLLEREPWREALDLLEGWQALSLLDSALQRDAQRSRRLLWGKRLGLPLMPLLLAAATEPLALARRLQIPGQQQQWLAQMLELRSWLLEGAPSVDAPPSLWTNSLEQKGWSPQAVGLMVALKPLQWRPLLRWWGRWRHVVSPIAARELIASGWQPGPGMGAELHRQRCLLLDRSR